MPVCQCVTAAAEVVVSPAWVGVGRKTICYITRAGERRRRRKEKKIEKCECLPNSGRVEQTLLSARNV